MKQIKAGLWHRQPSTSSGVCAFAPQILGDRSPKTNFHIPILPDFRRSEGGGGFRVAKTSSIKQRLSVSSFPTWFSNLWAYVPRIVPVLFLLVFSLSSLRGEELIHFSRDILPILSDNCFVCHGPDVQGRKASLRLDTHAGALGKGRSGEVAIQPGDSANSEVMRRLTTLDPHDVMPPPDSNRQLTPEQIQLIRRWIDQGAEWGRHWAFEPAQRPAVPALTSWDRNPIDAFIRHRLIEEELRPSSEAVPRTLLRRVTLDLTGLPPTPENVAEFMKNPSSEAYEQWVDRLLASPQFGERMAWDWLDAARYSDSNGYQGDGERTMWPWRDWVIEAFNRNLPYDAFTRWQLAGDRLPEPTHEQRLATGFLRNHMINGEGGRIPEENRVEYLFDQTETVATVWLAATFNCNRCHDHKFDPFTQQDYYSLLAFFNQTTVDGSGGNPQTPPILAVPTEEQSKGLESLNHKLTLAVQATERLEQEQEQAKAKPKNVQAKAEIGSGKAEEGSNVTDTILGSVPTCIPLDIPATAKSPAQEEKAPQVVEVPEAIVKLMRIPPKDRNREQLDTLLAHWKELEPEYANVLQSLRDARSQRDELAQSIPRVMVLDDQPKYRATYILNRGNYLEKGQEVPIALPANLVSSAFEEPISAHLAKPRTTSGSNSGAILSSEPDAEAVASQPALDRLDLANWLLDSTNPLTARVTVNRFWQMLFGTGLVKTTEDFGVQTEAPSHPELLDWLATEFVATGWDVKRLIRLMVTSATYRQDSRITPELQERDPENRLLARAPRFRMPSWMIRDTALAAAGLLEPTVGGAPVKTYQPAGVWEEATFGNKRYQQDHGEALYRRSLYIFWRRIVGPTLFFDVANRQVCTVRTPRTNVPLHALLTMNDVTYVEAARVLAQRIMENEGTSEARLNLTYQRVLNRPPKPAEQVLLLKSLERHQQYFSEHPQAASDWIQTGEAPLQSAPALDPVELAAWTLVCHTVLNLDEALTKE